MAAGLGASIGRILYEEPVASQASGADGCSCAAQVQDWEPPTRRDHCHSSEGHSLDCCAVSVSWYSWSSVLVQRDVTQFPQSAGIALNNLSMFVIENSTLGLTFLVLREGVRNEGWVLSSSRGYYTRQRGPLRVLHHCERCSCKLNHYPMKVAFFSLASTSVPLSCYLCSSSKSVLVSWFSSLTITTAHSFVWLTDCRTW